MGPGPVTRRESGEQCLASSQTSQTRANTTQPPPLRTKTWRVTERVSTSAYSELFNDGVCFVSVLSVYLWIARAYSVAGSVPQMTGGPRLALQDVTIVTIDDGIGVSNKSSFIWETPSSHLLHIGIRLDKKFLMLFNICVSVKWSHPHPLRWKSHQKSKWIHNPQYIHISGGVLCVLIISYLA